MIVQVQNVKTFWIFWRYKFLEYREAEKLISKKLRESSDKARDADTNLRAARSVIPSTIKSRLDIHRWEAEKKFWNDANTHWILELDSIDSAIRRP